MQSPRIRIVVTGVTNEQPVVMATDGSASAYLSETLYLISYPAVGCQSPIDVCLFVCLLSSVKSRGRLRSIHASRPRPTSTLLVSSTRKTTLGDRASPVDATQ